MSALISLILLIFIAFLFSSPLFGLFGQINQTAFSELFTSPSFAKALKVTLISAFGGSAISVALGIVFARQFALHNWRFKRIQRLLILLPYLAPNFILATAYVVAWNPATGLLNSFLKFPAGLYGLWGMTFLFGVAHIPVAFLLLEEKIKRIDQSLREAAKLSGANSLKILISIELPLLTPTLISAFGLCFALNISAFAIPAWIGAPEKIYPLTYKIYQAIQVGGADGIPQAASFSIILFVLALPPLLLNTWVQRREKMYALVSGKAGKKGGDHQSAGSFGRFQLLFWFTQVLFWMAPLACLITSTLVKPGCLQESGLSCLKEISLRSYRYVLFDLREAGAAFHGSFLYGTLSAIFIMGLSILILAALSRSRQSLKVIEWIFGLLVATPGAIIALGLIVTCSGRYGINLYNTAWIVIAAFILKHMSLAFQPLRTGMSNISSSLFEAARLSGAGPTQVWTSIVLPILRPEVFGGFFLVLIPILGELTMSIFLASPSFRSIGTVLFDLQDYSDQASAAALSIVLIAVILAVNELARFLSKGRLGY